MFANTEATSGFAVDDLQKAKDFYEQVLGLSTTIQSEEFGVMTLHLANNHDVLVYAKPDFTPATYTILNFQVDDIDAAVDNLTSRGITFERYDEMDQDDKAIARGPGPQIAWFKDPAGNILSALQDS
jgi:predicted enzyme related to lactoylglutathione lyase